MLDYIQVLFQKLKSLRPDLQIIRDFNFIWKKTNKKLPLIRKGSLQLFFFIAVHAIHNYSYIDA